MQVRRVVSKTAETKPATRRGEADYGEFKRQKSCPGFLTPTYTVLGACVAPGNGAGTQTHDSTVTTPFIPAA